MELRNLMDERVMKSLLKRVSMGDSPVDIAKAAQERRVSTIETLRFLRIHFSLGIAEAKEAMVRSHGHASLSEYEETTIEPIMRALDAIESGEEDSTTD